MAWHARLDLDYRLEHGRTVARFLHDGPLRVLQSLYPEGDAICHNVLVHPPGGLVGGDVLDITVDVDTGAHGLVTTPGATRFYRSDGPLAQQRTRLRLAPGARLEWLPLEALCYSGCHAENRLQIEPAPGALCLAWDVTALGLPHADQPFVQGSLQQHLELPGVWLERGLIDAADTRLLQSPVGLAGHRCLASLVLAGGDAFTREQAEAALDAARACVEAHPLAATAGVTQPHPQVLVLRVLAPVVEPAMELLKAVRGAWRQQFWQRAAEPPRIWAM
ncbi:urease accessory protein UreD [Acidovorax lacteus]|uniref:Urease accessory protein UreD n=1 Tax=Acidovorax lacteus TaxID=1924988 RepID=A0ABP8LKE8_9BURK